MRIFSANKKNKYNGLTGILAIDEFEASLHPIAQMNLFNFLFDWSRKYKVKIILNTHSLFLIQNIYLSQKERLEHKRIIINFIASQFEEDNILSIYENPPYNLAYSELTLSDYTENSNLAKVKILCEDEVAELLLKRVIKTQKILSQINFSHVVNDDNPGTSYTLLTNLCKSFPNILNETMSMVVLDADIDCRAVKVGKFPHVLNLPSLFDGLPFEKELIKYILTLDGSNAFFKKFKKQKEMFKQSFTRYKVPLNVENYKNEDVKPFKNWYDANKNDAKKYLTYYVNDNRELFNDFLKHLLQHVNDIRTKNGFTKIED